MPKKKKKSYIKADCISVPPGSELTINASGLSVEHKKKAVAELKWDDVQTIFGFTRIDDGNARLCLHFVLPNHEKGTEYGLFVADDVKGWEQLHKSLCKKFPNLNKEWAKSAFFEEASELADLAPTYVANPVKVWERQDQA